MLLILNWLASREVGYKILQNFIQVSSPLLPLSDVLNKAAQAGWKNLPSWALPYSRPPYRLDSHQRENPDRIWRAESFAMIECFSVGRTILKQDSN